VRAAWSTGRTSRHTGAEPLGLAESDSVTEPVAVLLPVVPSVMEPVAVAVLLRVLAALCDVEPLAVCEPVPLGVGVRERGAEPVLVPLVLPVAEQVCEGGGVAPDDPVPLAVPVKELEEVAVDVSERVPLELPVTAGDAGSGNSSGDSTGAAALRLVSKVPILAIIDEEEEPAVKPTNASHEVTSAQPSPACKLIACENTSWSAAPMREITTVRLPTA
jgi:hypothetical protein